MAYLYRVRDAQAALLYIGITENMWGRFLNGHQHSASWWADMADLSAEWYDDMRSARAAETAAIAAERPAFNIADSPDGRLARLARWDPRPWMGPDQFEARMALYERAMFLIRQALRRGW